MAAALGVLWSAAGVDGCYGSHRVAPSDQPGVPCSLASLLRFGHLRDVARLPGGTPIVCGAVAVREDGGGHVRYLPANE